MGRLICGWEECPLDLPVLITAEFASGSIIFGDADPQSLTRSLAYTRHKLEWRFALASHLTDGAALYRYPVLRRLPPFFVIPGPHLARPPASGGLKDVYVGEPRRELREHRRPYMVMAEPPTATEIHELVEVGVEDLAPGSRALCVPFLARYLPRPSQRAATTNLRRPRETSAPSRRARLARH
ncbi:hypothetical protein DL769_008085 [Monosporascus sp. CRB-8-3]|nr:hypothetical protein DL769_008085 [Monosporascus sp. CRB-8-3]